MNQNLLKQIVAAFLFFIAATAVNAATYITVDGIRYVYNSTKTYVSVASLKSPSVYVGDIVIPETITNTSGEVIPVKAVKSSAFSDCTDVTSVTLPSSVTSIGDYAFDSCEKLEYVVMPGVQTIGHWAFRNCYVLENLTFGQELTTIGNYCFDKNLKMTRVVLPASTTLIGGYAIEGNPQITEVYSYCANPPEIKKGYLDGEEIYTIFDDTDYSGRTLYVPTGSMNAYKSQLGWNYFPEIKEFDPAGVANVSADKATISVVSSGKGEITVTANAKCDVKVVSINGSLVKDEAVQEGVTVLGGLSKGIYIVNGKKLIVK